MSDNEFAKHDDDWAGVPWRHWLTMVGVALVVIAVGVAVFLVVRDANATSTGSVTDRSEVEQVYDQFAAAVQSGDVSSAGICAGREEAAKVLTQLGGSLGGLGTAGGTVRTNVEAVVVDGTAAHVEGSLNSMGTNLDMPLDLRKIDGTWCVWG
ncbi:MAG: hypothetical protein WBA38_16635 [Gordonia sp. (in: high G+C Gram-positive bacteria)]|uniref:hypothetical protein n=1 Tax=Gordonia sp. (in: high G+C Gram-positive bacteria) TaxID=84139 RepID=UPI003C71BF33